MVLSFGEEGLCGEVGEERIVDVVVVVKDCFEMASFLWKNSCARLPNDAELLSLVVGRGRLRSSDGNRRPKPIFSSHFRYIFVASAPMPKKKKTAYPTASWIQWSNSTMPLVGMRVTSHHIGP